MAKLEIACFNTESALIAQQNGADRVEICDEISLGGITPSYEFIKKVKQQLSIDVVVMIRPRGGNFVYSDAEFKQMKDAILKIKNLGVNGFVFGILNSDNTINTIQNKDLVKLAHPIPCTFHRAFDEVLDYKKALADVITCRFSTILSSGTHATVINGKEVLKELVSLSNNRINIMPGGGLRSSNLKEIYLYTKATYFHSSAITDATEVANSEEIKNLKAILNA